MELQSTQRKKGMKSYSACSAPLLPRFFKNRESLGLSAEASESEQSWMHRNVFP